MDIQITQREQAGAERHVDVTVPADAVEALEEKTTRRYASQARLPGFRPGKAPTAMVRKRFADAIRQDTLQEIVQDAYKRLLEQEKLEVINQPHIHDLKFEPGQPLTFTFHLEVRPEIKLERLGGFNVPRPSGEVTEEMVQQQLDQVRDQRAVWAPTEDNPITGDKVKVHLWAADEAGQMVDAGELDVTLGDGKLPEVVEELVMETKPGSTTERPVRYPDDFPAPELAGKTKVIRAEVKEVKRKDVPVLDDALARELGDFDSVDALREAVRKDLEAQVTRDADAEVRGKLLDEILEANPFDVPPSWVRQLVDSYAQAYNIPEEDRERFAVEFRPLAERQVRRDLVVDQIARQESLRATEADVDEKVSELAQARNMEPGKLYAALQQAGRLSEIEHGITEERVFKWLADRNTMQ
jgi:trigger factor